MYSQVVDMNIVPYRYSTGCRFMRYSSTEGWNDGAMNRDRFIYITRKNIFWDFVSFELDAKLFLSCKRRWNWKKCNFISLLTGRSLNFIKHTKITFLQNTRFNLYSPYSRPFLPLASYATPVRAPASLGPKIWIEICPVNVGLESCTQCTLL